MFRCVVKNALTKVGSNRTAIASVIRRHSTTSETPAIKDQEQSDPLEDSNDPVRVKAPEQKREKSERIAEFRKKLKEDLAAEELNRYNFMNPIKDDPLPPWPDNVNPHTGEVGGPRGPEPTRYGDWERKGITVDF